MSRPPSGPQSEWSNQMLENLVVGLIVSLLLAAVARLPKLVRARWQRRRLWQYYKRLLESDRDIVIGV